MANRRRPFLPDNRPDWRDPNMPLVRNYRMANGTVKELVEPEYEQRYREHMISASMAPNYKHDPTYNLRRRK